MADDLGREPIPGVAGASGCPHPTRLLTPICSRKRGKARQVDDASQTAIQPLGAGQSLTDSFTAVSSDGTASRLVTVTIHGTNDTPLISGTSTGAVTEDNGADD